MVPAAVKSPAATAYANVRRLDAVGKLHNVRMTTGQQKAEVVGIHKEGSGAMGKSHGNDGITEGLT